MTVRAYSGINVAKTATVSFEPDFSTDRSVSNLLTMGPRTLGFTRHPYVFSGSTIIVDTGVESCSESINYAIQAVITFELDKKYVADAILVLGQLGSQFHISEFYLYVGDDPDYTKNRACPGYPFAVRNYAEYG